MTVLEALAERESLLRYAALYDEFADLEQGLAGEPEAEIPHEYALLVVNAYRAELDDRDVGSEVPRLELIAALSEVHAILRPRDEDTETRRLRAQEHDTNAREGWR